MTNLKNRWQLDMSIVFFFGWAKLVVCHRFAFDYLISSAVTKHYCSHKSFHF